MQRSDTAGYGTRELHAALARAEHLCAHEHADGPAAARDVASRAQASKDHAVEARARLALAWAILEYDPAEARANVEQAARIADTMQEPAIRAQAQCMTARLCVIQGDAVGVLRHAHTALLDAEAARHVEHRVHAHSLIGVAYLLTGDSTRALVHEEEVLKHLDEVTSPSLRACLLCDIGANFNSFGSPEDARVFLQRAYAITLEHDLGFARILVAENLGRALLQLGHVEEGEQLLHEGLEAAVRGRLPRWEAYLRCTLGEHQVLRGETQTGFVQLNRALSAAQDVEDTFLIATVRAMLGRALRELNRHEEARAELNLALDAATRAELLGPAKDAHLELSEVLAQQAAFEPALHHHRLYHALAMKVQLEEARRHAQLLMLQQELDRERQNTEAERQLNDQLRRAHAVVQQQADEMARMAREDALTGLANRRHFMERLHVHLRSRHAFAVLLVDVDHFKNVNDRFGHPIGDEVLRRLGHALEQQVRDEDLVARFGGEEFAVLLHAASIERAAEVAERLRHAVAHQNWDDLTPGIAVTVSIGVAHAAEAACHERLISLADHRLYEAKQRGRNRVA